MPEAKQKTYAIGELAKEFDITTRSIRFYEDLALLTPQRNGQTRIYSVKDRVRLKLILRGKRLGFTLAETKTIFDLYDSERTGKKQLDIMLALIKEKRHILAQQLLDINAVVDELDELELSCESALNSIT